MTLMWAANRKALRSKGRGHRWHLTPTVLPAERPEGRIPTLCGHYVSEQQIRRPAIVHGGRRKDEPPISNLCPRCLLLG